MCIINNCVFSLHQRRSPFHKILITFQHSPINLIIFEHKYKKLETKAVLRLPKLQFIKIW